MAALYASDAILLSAFNPTPLDTPTGIAGYFRNLTQNPNLKAEIQTEKVVVLGDGAANSGIYTFSFTREGKEVRVPARFVFVYRRDSGRWLIVSNRDENTTPLSLQ